VVPALAVADALRAEGAEVSFVGTRERAEAELVPEAGYEIDFLRVRGLDRRNPARAAQALALAAGAVPAARAVLRRRGAAAVLGGGGYVAAPAGVAALALRLPLVLTEADRHLGLANRLLARRARRVCLAFPIAGLENERFLVTGRPVPGSISTADRGAARERFGLEPGQRCLLVFGGSQGARSINLAALEGLLQPERAFAFHVLHITGTRDYQLAQARLAAAGHGAEQYTLLDYEPTLADGLAACDLVLARAGASVFELAAAGRPAILVPYPHATGRHQHANAEWMASAGAATVIEDSELTGELVWTRARELLADGERLGAMSAASASLAMPEAAERVAAEVLATVIK
jgi:UDP-N-acetylglucosamine--N-acetylmuramyl-(pentapeptide) pyrophosphoryl-undecaprenol N-acetylglucosamine transferase